MKKHNLDLDWFEDADRDGIPNLVDCAPFDKTKDGFLGRALNVVTRGKKGQSKEDYEEEKEEKHKKKLIKLEKKAEIEEVKGRRAISMAEARARISAAKATIKENKPKNNGQVFLEKLRSMKQEAQADKARQTGKPLTGRKKMEQLVGKVKEKMEEQTPSVKQSQQQSIQPPKQNFNDMLGIGGGSKPNKSNFNDILGFVGGNKKQGGMNFNQMLGMGSGKSGKTKMNFDDMLGMKPRKNKGKKKSRDRNDEFNRMLGGI